MQNIPAVSNIIITPPATATTEEFRETIWMKPVKMHTYDQGLKAIAILQIGCNLMILSFFYCLPAWIFRNRIHSHCFYLCILNKWVISVMSLAMKVMLLSTAQHSNKISELWINMYIMVIPTHSLMLSAGEHLMRSLKSTNWGLYHEFSNTFRYPHC